MNVGVSNSVTIEIRGSVKGMSIGKTRTTEKANRVTVEQLLHGVLFCMHANVYHATKADGQQLAIKVNKTSVLNMILKRATMVEGSNYNQSGKGSARQLCLRL